MAAQKGEERAPDLGGGRGVRTARGRARARVPVARHVAVEAKQKPRHMLLPAEEERRRDI
uniref:Uncharacterized protein n=1 Tax=Oryza nivara TaxID=4536 RepID=A0A0E0G8T7_ORYNI